MGWFAIHICCRASALPCGNGDQSHWRQKPLSPALSPLIPHRGESDPSAAVWKIVRLGSLPSAWRKGRLRRRSKVKIEDEDDDEDEDDKMMARAN